MSDTVAGSTAVAEKEETTTTETKEATSIATEGAKTEPNKPKKQPRPNG